MIIVVSKMVDENLLVCLTFRYPDGLIEQLHVVLFEPDQGSPLIRLLCSTILRELSPRPNVIVPPFVPPVDLKQTAFVLPLLTVQVIF